MKKFMSAGMMMLVAVTQLGAQDPLEPGGITVQSLRLAEQVPPILFCHVVTADEGAPMWGVQVFLDGTRIGALSDQSGFVELAIPEAGTWTLRVRLIGYHEERVSLDLERGTLTQVLIGLRMDSAAVRNMPILAPPPVPTPRDTAR